MYSKAPLAAAVLLLFVAVTAAAAQSRNDEIREEYARLRQEAEERRLEREQQLVLREAEAATPEERRATATAINDYVKAQRARERIKKRQNMQQRRSQQRTEKRKEERQRELENRQEMERRRDLMNIAKRHANFGSGDILDTFVENGTLASLSNDNIARFLNNEASVNSVAGCFAGRETCYSEGARLLVDHLLALQPGTLCLECEPGEEERLNEVIYLLVSGLSTRYPEQWSVMFPHIFSTIAAFQAQRAARQQFS